VVLTLTFTAWVVLAVAVGVTAAAMVVAIAGVVLAVVSVVAVVAAVVLASPDDTASIFVGAIEA
jgi:hypothetical protein